MVFITVCEGAAQHYIKEERMMRVTAPSSAGIENLRTPISERGPRTALVHCKELCLHKISPLLYLPIVLVPLAFPAPLCSLSFTSRLKPGRAISQPGVTLAIQDSSSLAKGGSLYGFIQPTPVTAAVETGAKCKQPECEVQDHGSLILMLLAQV